MTELEALNIVIEKIPDIETVDNELNVIKTALENKENNTEKGDDFRTKYEELREKYIDRKSTRLNSSHPSRSRMPSSA